MRLSIGYITCRQKPMFDWFLGSLASQIKPEDQIQIILVDLWKANRPLDSIPPTVLHVEPKPNVWGGRHRITSKDWWHASACRNSIICLAQHPFVSFVDDRSVLLPGWLDAVREAQKGKYAVFGAYEKRTGMIVENGVITHGGIVVGEDAREKYVREHWGGTVPAKCPGEWAFGCTLALPLEWALAVNGVDEFCDGAGFEDVFFGLFLSNSGYDTRYDFRMKIVEDRTPSEIEDVIRKRDKGISPTDKSHAIKERLQHLKTASHPINLRQIRHDVMRGLPWPAPWGPFEDWFDGEKVSEME